MHTFFSRLSWPLKAALPALAAVLLTAVVSTSFITMKDVTVTNQATGQITPAAMPVMLDSTPNSVYTIEGRISRNPFTQKLLRIVPDDRLVSMSVNGSALPLDAVRSGSLSDWNRGFIYSLGDYLQNGDNTVTFVIADHSGKYGLHFYPAVSPAVVVLICLAALLVLIALWSLLTGLKRNNATAWILITGLGARVLYLLITPFNLRSNDPEAHMEYIEYISSTLSLPDPAAGWAFYHPPLYYIPAGLVHRLLEWLGMDQRGLQISMQVFSLIISMAVLAVTIAIVRMLARTETWGHFRLQTARIVKNLRIPAPIKAFLKPDHLITLITALFVFWPSGIVHSVRVGNDALFYLFCTLFLYWLYRWVISAEKKPLSLYQAFAMALGAFLTKSTGVILLPVIGLVWLVQRWRSVSIRQRLIEIMAAGLLFTAAFLVVFRGQVATILDGRTQKSFLVSNAQSLHSGLFVGNNLYNYLWFDVKIFVTEPFTEAWDDTQGRQYFWNYFWKTGLFGQYVYNWPVMRTLGTLISIVFLGWIGILIYGLTRMSRSAWRESLLHLLLAGVFCAASIAFRVSIPASCSNDFRYVAPVMVPLLFLWFFSLQALLRTGRLKTAITGLSLSILLILFSAAFFTALFFVSMV